MAVSRILAVTHETSITGAPMNLLHLLTWIRDNTDVEVHTIAMQDGPLRERFEKTGPVTVLDGSRAAALVGIAERGLARLGFGVIGRRLARQRTRRLLRELGEFDLVYLNSLASTGLLAHFDDDINVVCHVHELQVAFRGLHYTGLEEIFRQRPDRWIACSGAVRDMLVDDVGLPPERVLLHHEFIDVDAISSRRVTEDERDEVLRWRASAGIPQDAHIVMGTGTLEWRKGPHLFVQLARSLSERSDRPVHFVWVGGRLDGPDWHRIESEIRRCGLTNVHFVGIKPNPVPWFEIADVFALTSHEDPYPLVCLEHAAMAHPIVTFQNGGMPELLEAAGPAASRGIVRHLDVDSMADRIEELLADSDFSATVGNSLRDAVATRHDAPSAAAALYADLSSIAASHSIMPGSTK